MQLKLFRFFSHLESRSHSSVAFSVYHTQQLYYHLGFCISAEVPINVLEGEDVSLDFNFTVTDFSLLQLRQNGELLYQSRGGVVTNRRRKRIDVSKTAGNTRITLEDVDQADSGTFQCLLTGTKKDPVYNVSVTCEYQLSITIVNGTHVDGKTNYCKIICARNLFLGSGIYL